MSDRSLKAKIIGNKISEIREKAGKNQSELADESGVSRAAISLIEKGERYPSLIVLRKLAGALKATVEELTGETVPSRLEINEEAQAFFRQWSTLDNLNDEDKEAIRTLIKHFKGKGKENDKRRK